MQTPGPIQYERATSVQNAIELLEKYGPETRILAGGHSLLPMMKLRLANPERLIDINDLDELSYIREVDGEVRIGAMTRHRELLESELLARQFPLFIDAEEVIADPPVRNRGTIGGSLAQADAAEDLSAVCSALKANVVIVGSDGERVVSMDDFHVGPFMTAIQDGQVLTEIRLPVRPAERQRPREGRAQGGGLGDSRRLRRPLAGGRENRRRGCGAQRRRADHDPRDALRGAAAWQGAHGGALRRGGRLASEDCSPIADGRGPVDYKRHLAGVLTRRALSRAAERASNQEG